MQEIKTVDELIEIKQKTIELIEAEKKKCIELVADLEKARAAFESEKDALEDRINGINSRINNIFADEQRNAYTISSPVEYEFCKFMERLQISFIKNLPPTTFISTRSMRKKDGNLVEEIPIFENPLVRIAATIYDESKENVYSRKRVNNIICRINLEWSKVFINDMLLSQMEGHEYHNYDYFFNIQGKAFKTHAEAKAWFDKNGAKYYTPVVTNIKAFLDKIAAAEPDFSKVFDFRLFTGDQLTRGHYNDYTYVVLSKKKTEMILDLKPKIHEDFHETLKERTLDNPIVVFLEGINFRIHGGTEEDRKQVDAALRRYFGMEVWEDVREKNNNEN